MTAPNLIAATTVTGKIQPYALTVNLASALSNGSNSGTCLRVYNVRVSNTGASSITVSVSLYRSSTHYYIVKAIPVQTSASLVVLQRDEFVYLEEGDSLYMQASAATADSVITYDVWS